MPTQAEFSLAEPLSSLWVACIGSLTASEPFSVNVVVDNTSGFKSIDFWMGPESSEDYHNTFLYLPIEAGQTGTVRGLLATGSLSLVSSWNPFNPPDGVGWPEVELIWVNTFVNTIANILEAFCGASVSLGDPLSLTFAGGLLRHVTMDLRVTTASETFIISTALFMSKPNGDALPLIVINPAQYPAPLAAHSGGSSGPDLSKVIQALEDLAYKTTVYSINDNQAIADLSAGDIVTT